MCCSYYPFRWISLLTKQDWKQHPQNFGLQKRGQKEKWAIYYHWRPWIWKAIYCSAMGYFLGRIFLDFSRIFCNYLDDFYGRCFWCFDLNIESLNQTQRALWSKYYKLFEYWVRMQLKLYEKIDYHHQL